MIHALRLPFGLDPLIAEAKRRARQRRAIAAAGGLLLVVLAATLAIAFHSPGGGPAGAAPTTSYLQPATKLGVTYPTAWHITKPNWITWTDPEPRFVLYSGRLPQHGNFGEVLGPPRAGQVVGLLMEQKPPLSRGVLLRGFPARPAHLQATHLTQRVEGFSGDWQEITFRDRGRAFYLFVGAGPGGAALVPTLLRALDTLRVGN
jgi:hypothetical protein